MSGASDSQDNEFAQKVLAALSKIQDPDLNKDIVSLGFVKELLIKKTLLGKRDVSFTIELTTPACPVKDQFKKDAQLYVSQIPGVGRVDVKMTAQVRNSRRKGSLPGIRKIIAVGSGKGGVGKSTVAVNLAFALKRLGARVALLDGDIYGPSFAQMLHLNKAPKVANSKILPVEAYGIPTMSFAFFAPIGEAVIWRGPQIAKAVQQMMQDVDWQNSPGNPQRDEIDYLIIDLPPGTGDIHLSVAQNVHIDGVVLVSTPQDVSLIDTMRGFYFFEKLKIRVLGLVENMSGFICPHCHERTDIFGSGGAEKKAQEKSIPFLGSLPLHPLVVTKGDKGVPLVEAEAEHFLTKVFLDIASRIAQEVSKIDFEDSNHAF
jgi:ATP-binding protein involved in chromosome partitioning